MSVIGVTHLTKSGGTEALARFIESGAIGAAARCAFLVARDADDPDRRLFVPAKNNLGQDKGGLAFRIVEKPAAHPLRAPAVDWLEPVDMTADEALAASVGEDRRGGKLDAVAFLKIVLAGGPQPAKMVEEQAAMQGISTDQLKRARKKLDVWSAKEGFAGGWHLGLPGQRKPGDAQAELI